MPTQNNGDGPGLIYAKIIAVMNDLDAIGKTRKNQAQNFMFRGIDDVYNALHPLFAKHGVFTVPTVVNRSYTESTSKSGTAMIERVLTLRYRFYASDGSYVEAEVDGEAMDSGDKASNKCMAIAHKYALLQVFCIPTEGDNDPDAHTPEARDPSQPRRKATTIKPEPTREPARATVAPKTSAYETGEIVALPSAPQANRGTSDEVQADIEAATHGSTDEAKRQKILAKAIDVLYPLGPGSPPYLWAMQEIFHSQDWNVIKGFSLKKLDADTRGRIAKIVEQAMDTSEELAAKLLEEDGERREGNPPVRSVKAKLTSHIRAQIERIPEGPARESAMSNAFGSTSWGELETYSLKEVEEVVEGKRVEKIVEDAIKASAKGAK